MILQIGKSLQPHQLIIARRHKIRRNDEQNMVDWCRRNGTGLYKSTERGVTSFNFDLTEWSHAIELLQIAERVKEKWFIANSSHVADLAFYLGGEPQQISFFTSERLSWHPSASVFSGAGVSDKGALFSYQANWAASGRWSVDILTRKHRLIFCPLEKLKIQKIGSVAIDFVDIEDRLDIEYKPGLFRQTEAFLKNQNSHLCTIQQQAKNLKVYSKMANYAV
jgi:hypothetical protein